MSRVGSTVCFAQIISSALNLGVRDYGDESAVQEESALRSPGDPLTR